MATTLRLATDHASGISETNPAHVEEILADIRRALPYGAQTQIERRTGIPAGTIQDQLSTRPRHRAALLVVLEALAEIRLTTPNGRRVALDIHQRLVAPLGHVVSEPIPASGADPYVAFHRAIAEVGDVARVFAEHPGPLSHGLRTTLLREATEARDAIEAVIAAINGGAA